MKNVLFIVYYFPPMGGSGVQRPLKFAKYLREFGWNPIILCPEPGIYHTFDESLQTELDSLGLNIYRVKGNTPFHFTKMKKLKLPSKVENILRRISTFFWLPDNKKGWIKEGLKEASSIINKHKIDLIFSTAAPYSNLQLASQIKEITGIKVVMDLRDEWLNSHLIKYPTHFHYLKMKGIEKKTLSNVDAITVINEAYHTSFRSRYPDKDIRTVYQGYDPADFDQEHHVKDKRFRLLYNGLFYGDRNPDQFLHAAAKVIHESPKVKHNLILQFQGGIPEKSWDLIRMLRIESNIEDLGYVSHKQSLKNLMLADALWLVIGHTHKAEYVTLGKMYEYFGVKKPILGLVPQGDSKKMLKNFNASYIAEPNDTADIERALKKMLSDIKNKLVPDVNISFINKFNRKILTQKLAQIFDEISS